MGERDLHRSESMESRQSRERSHTKTRWAELGLAVVAGLAGAGQFAHAQKSPEETRQLLQVAEGLEASVFASEPMFANPCDMDVDARGRVWVTEGWNYRGSRLRPNEGD